MISPTYHVFEKSLQPCFLNQNSGVITVPIQFLKSQPSTSPLGSLYYAQLAALRAIEVYDYLSSSLTPSDIRSFSPVCDSPPALLDYVDDNDIEDIETEEVEELVSTIRVWSR